MSNACLFFVICYFNSIGQKPLQLVLMTSRVHPFPCRTRKLSSIVPKILGWWRPGKIGRCQHLYSSIAQSVERMTVNHDVTGSSPVGGAKKTHCIKLVLMTQGVHPFPCRTRKLSPVVPTILGWWRPGKIGRCQYLQWVFYFWKCLWRERVKARSRQIIYGYFLRKKFNIFFFLTNLYMNDKYKAESRNIKDKAGK